jgi:hypothetical protein
VRSCFRTSVPIIEVKDISAIMDFLAQRLTPMQGGGA